MKGAGILSVRWAAAAIVAAMLVPPQALGAQGPAQGINVHGHWVIEVRNADGTVQVRREFENALLPTGKTTLINLFTGGAPMGLWAITVTGNPGPCSGQCNITEPNFSGFGGANTFKNLTKTANLGASEFVLQGSFVAANDASVFVVVTTVENSGFFTSANFSPIAVQATQTVSVTVTFTFS